VKEIKETMRPIEIDFLRDKDIIDVQCGEQHSIAIGRDERVYSWGEGAMGRLGVGYDEK
jgi:alpha-tubulin suppressor-like RCC1 family protein